MFVYVREQLQISIFVCHLCVIGFLGFLFVLFWDRISHCPRDYHIDRFGWIKSPFSDGILSLPPCSAFCKGYGDLDSCSHSQHSTDNNTSPALSIFKIMCIITYKSANSLGSYFHTNKTESPCNKKKTISFM